MDPEQEQRIAQMIAHAEQLQKFGMDENTIVSVVTGAAPMPPEWIEKIRKANEVPPPPNSSALGAGLTVAGEFAKGGWDVAKDIGGGLKTAFTQNPLTTAKDMAGSYLGGVGDAFSKVGEAATSDLPWWARATETLGRTAALPLDVLTGGMPSRIGTTGQDAVAEGDPRKGGRALTEALLTSLPFGGGPRAMGAVRGTASAVRHPINTVKNVAGSGTGQALSRATAPARNIANMDVMELIGMAQQAKTPTVATSSSMANMPPPGLDPRVVFRDTAVAPPGLDPRVMFGYGANFADSPSGALASNLAQPRKPLIKPRTKRK